MSTPFPHLETARLLLTPLALDDISDFFALLSDKKVTRYLGIEPLVDLAQAETLLLDYAARHEAGVELRWALRDKGKRRLLGECTLAEPHSPRRRAELGYLIAPRVWRQGYASEGVRAVLAYAFGPLGLNRVEAMAFAENTASRALLLKLGFTQEGYLRQHAWEKGRYWDDVIFALLAEEYAAQLSTP